MKRFIASKKIFTRFILLGVCVFALSTALNTEALTVSPVRIEINADAGEVYEGTYRLTNDSVKSRTYFSSFQNFRADGETGTPYFVEEATQLASWLDGPDVVTLAPHESRDVPFTITIPEDTNPGGYFSASFWMTSPSNVSGGNISSVSFRVGILILLRVNGDIVEDGGIIDFTSNKDFMTSPSLELQYRFQNDGGDRLLPKGNITITNMFGNVVDEFDANPGIGNVLPESRRQFDLLWFGNGATVVPVVEDTNFFGHAKSQWDNFYLGTYMLNLDLSYGNEVLLSDHASVKVLIIPIQLLSLLISILLLLVFGYQMIKRAMRRQVARQVARISATLNQDAIKEKMENQAGVKENTEDKALEDKE